jgi:hypothetical protein
MPSHKTGGRSRRGSCSGGNQGVKAADFKKLFEAVNTLASSASSAASSSVSAVHQNAMTLPPRAGFQPVTRGSPLADALAEAAGITQTIKLSRQEADAQHVLDVGKQVPDGDTTVKAVVLDEITKAIGNIAEKFKDKKFESITMTDLVKVVKDILDAESKICNERIELIRPAEGGAKHKLVANMEAREAEKLKKQMEEQTMRMLPMMHAQAQMQSHMQMDLMMKAFSFKPQ